MNKIKIDNVEYELDTLTDKTKAELASLNFCDQEIGRLQMQIAALQTARHAYANEVKMTLNPTAVMGDKISFN